MKCNPLRWLWGVIPVLMLSWISVLGEHTRIESDLQARVGEALSKAGLSWAGSGFSGRDGIVSGLASDDADPQRAYDIVRNVWGVRVVDNKAGLIEKADNYIWTAAIRDNRVKLSGFVPSEEARRTVVGVAQATFPGREIQDLTKLARGAPPRDAWLGGVSFALKQLAQLKRGNVDLDGTALTVAGEAEDTKAYNAVKTAISGNLPQGVRLKLDKVTPPVVQPYVWSATHQGRQVLLTGYVPSKAASEQIEADARKAFPKQAVLNRMEFAAGEPKGYEAIVPAALRALAELEEGKAELKDAAVTVSGMAATDEVADTARKTLRQGAPAGLRLADQIKAREVLPKPVSPFVTSASIQEGVVTLTGYVPSEPARVALLETVRARLPGKRINDQLQLAGGQPEGWQACVQAGLLGLGRLGNGTLAMTDRRMVLTGSTRDEAVHTAVPADVRAAANRACDADVKVSLQADPEPDLNWRATRSEGQVVLDGEVPDPAVRAELLSEAGKLFPNYRIVDRMVLRPASSRKWGDVASLGLKSLARLRTGEASVRGQTLSVTGEAPDTAAVGWVKDQLGRSLPSGYAGREQLAVRSDAMIWAEQEAKRKSDDEARRKAEEEAKRKAAAEEEARRKAAAEDEARRKSQDLARRQADADRCKVQLTAIAREGVINFKRASWEIEGQSFPTLDRLVAVARSCPEAKVEVEGHTDAEGTDERNQLLSERRANAVAEYLIKSGIDAARVQAIGYGAQRPVAPNDTPGNRARNRRIEFEVKVN